MSFLPRTLLPALTALALPASVAAQQETDDAMRAVAVIEERASTGVLNREILTRQDLEQLLVDRADAYLVGFNHEELREEMPLRDEPPRDNTAAEAPQNDGGRSNFFQRSREGLNVETPPADRPNDRRNVLVLEGVMTSGESHEPTSPGMEQGLQRLREEMQNPDENALSRRQRRYRIQFENQVIDEWVDHALLKLEATRRGLSVTEEQIISALVPMIQARQTQVESPQEAATPGEQPVAANPAEAARLAEILQRLQTNPADPTGRQAIRAEVSEILREHSHDPQRFFHELEENLLTDQLVRATVYQFYSEQDLRAFHQTFKQQFISPQRVRLLGVKFLMRPDDPSLATDQIEDAFNGLQRRLRRIGADEPLPAVTQAWHEAVAAESDLPALTYISLSQPQIPAELPTEVAQALTALGPGETSDVIQYHEGPPGNSFTIFTVVRLVEVLPEKGDNFDDVRPLVEEQFLTEVRGQLLAQLKQRYDIWTNRRGAPIEEALSEIGSPRASSGTQSAPAAGDASGTAPQAPAPIPADQNPLGSIDDFTR